MTSEKFESLSDEELYALADKMGLDLPPGLARVFVAEEILEALEEDSLERRSSASAPMHVDEKKFSCSDALSGVDECRASAAFADRRYNETMIRALVRDPSWAFAYWDIAEADRSALHADGVASLFLRVVELDEGGESAREFFDIPISEGDAQWYINLPHAKARYRIELRLRSGSRSRLLARSTALSVPRQTLEFHATALDARSSELLRLSGLEGLGIEPPPAGNPLRILSGGEGE